VRRLPAQLSALLGVNGVESGDRLVGNKCYSSVYELDASGRNRVNVISDVVNDGFHAELSHFAGILLSDCSEVAIRDGLDAATAAVDRDH
jgi:hypothetical protein